MANIVNRRAAALSEEQHDAITQQISHLEFARDWERDIAESSYKRQQLLGGLLKQTAGRSAAAGKRIEGEKKETANQKNQRREHASNLAEQGLPPLNPNPTKPAGVTLETLFKGLSGIPGGGGVQREGTEVPTPEGAPPSMGIPGGTVETRPELNTAGRVLTATGHPIAAGLGQLFRGDVSRAVRSPEDITEESEDIAGTLARQQRALERGDVEGAKSAQEFATEQLDRIKGSPFGAEIADLARVQFREQEEALRTQRITAADTYLKFARENTDFTKDPTGQVEKDVNQIAEFIRDGKDIEAATLRTNLAARDKHLGNKLKIAQVRRAEQEIRLANNVDRRAQNAESRTAQLFPHQLAAVAQEADLREREVVARERGADAEAERVNIERAREARFKIENNRKLNQEDQRIDISRDVATAGIAVDAANVKNITARTANIGLNMELALKRDFREDEQLKISQTLAQHNIKIDDITLALKDNEQRMRQSGLDLQERTFQHQQFIDNKMLELKIDTQDTQVRQFAETMAARAATEGREAERDQFFREQQLSQSDREERTLQFQIQRQAQAEARADKDAIARKAQFAFENGLAQQGMSLREAAFAFDRAKQNSIEEAELQNLKAQGYRGVLGWLPDKNTMSIDNINDAMKDSIVDGKLNESREDIRVSAQLNALKHNELRLVNPGGFRDGTTTKNVVLDNFLDDVRNIAGFRSQDIVSQEVSMRRLQDYGMQVLEQPTPDGRVEFVWAAPNVNHPNFEVLSKATVGAATLGAAESIEGRRLTNPTAGLGAGGQGTFERFFGTTAEIKSRQQSSAAQQEKSGKQSFGELLGTASDAARNVHIAPARALVETVLAPLVGGNRNAVRDLVTNKDFQEGFERGANR
ncbi:MAG: hypothetical protein GY737_00260 [Desulfobacteraceae bacterium]|nr:hypothetical protein [Desulfobacteraceae bacterium]